MLGVVTNKVLPLLLLQHVICAVVGSHEGLPCHEHPRGAANCETPLPSPPLRPQDCLSPDWETYPKPTNRSYEPRSLEMAAVRELTRDVKYFHEQTLSPFQAWHYDARFYKGTVEKSERQMRLTKLLSAWAQFTDDHGIASWLAGGSLDGFYWGQAILPWDDDLDMRILASDLARLDEMYAGGSEVQLNGTATKLDINPHHHLWQPLTHNKIDARVIDTDTGLFVDITGIHPARGDYGADAYNSDTIWQCKSPHESKLDSIFPLVRTTFQGVLTWRPRDFKQFIGRSDCLRWDANYFAKRGYRWTGDFPLLEHDGCGRQGSFVPAVKVAANVHYYPLLRGNMAGH